MKFAATLLLFPLLVSGLRLPIRSVPSKRGTKLSKGSALSNFKNLAAGSPSTKDQTLNITNNQDLIYIVDCNIGSLEVPLQLDSGSSDLWVDLTGKTVQGKASDLSINLTYGIGHAAGPIAQADVSFAGFDVPEQAYLAGTDVNNPATTYGAEGVLGMGFTSLSSIDAKVNASGGSWGRSLLYNIFSLNPSEPNFVAYKLDRHSDDVDDEGEFTIGELIPQYEGITQTGRISTFPQINPSRWTILIDKIIASGQSISVSSTVNNAPDGKAVALPDTGTSLVFAPLDIVHAIYGTIPGAKFSSPDNAYILDCSVEVDVSVVIAGRQFDIHPLDMVQMVAGADGKALCAGTWRPQTLTVGKSEFDILLGVAFMRSVYSVFDFGDFQADNQTMDNPYVRLWSVVNGSDASKEFHEIRGGTVNSTFLSNAGVNDPSADANVNSSGTGNAVSGVSLDSLQSSIDKLDKLVPILFALTGFNLFVLLGIAAVFFWRTTRRRRRNIRGASGRGSIRGSTRGGSNKNSAVPAEETMEVPSEESPGSYIPLPRPRAPGLQNEYRPLSSGSTLRDSQLYDPPKTPNSAKFDPGARYDSPGRDSMAFSIPEERYDPAPIRRNIMEVITPDGSATGPSIPTDAVPFPRQSVALTDVMAPPGVMQTPVQPRHSTADTIVVMTSGTGKSLDKEKSVSMSETSPTAQPRLRPQFAGLQPPEARYDPAARHSYAGIGEAVHSQFEQPTRRSFVSSNASGGEVTFDPLLRRSVSRTISSPESPLRQDPFIAPPPSPPQLHSQRSTEQLVSIDEAVPRPSTASSRRSRLPTPEPPAEAVPRPSTASSRQ